MIVKNYKTNVFIYGFVLLAFAVALTFNEKNVKVVIHDIYESFMSTDPGFSSISNVVKNGRNVHYSNSEKAIEILKRADDIIAYKLNSKPIKIPKIGIIIDFVDYKKILDDRRLALSKGYLHNPSIVKAAIEFNGKKYKADVRLKGDLSDHWISRYRMSLRVRIKGGGSILGMKSFSLHKPRARQYPYNQSYQQIIRESGGMSSVHTNLVVSVNGEEWGIMDAEEHISKEFIEKQNRKDSIIIRRSDDRKWLLNRALSKIEKERFESYRLSDPRIFSKLYRGKKYLKKDINRGFLTYILENHFNGRLDVLYDKDKHILGFLTSLIWNSMHTLYNNNSRYYFNPYTVKLEPITTDQADFSLHDRPLSTTLREISIPENYKSSLRLISNLDELDDYIGLAVGAFDNIQNVFFENQKTFPLDALKDVSILRDNINFILDNKNEIFSWIQELKSQNENSVNFELKESFEYDSDIVTQYLEVRHYSDGRLFVFNLLPEDVVINRILVDGVESQYSNITIPGHDNLNYTPFILQTDIKGIYDNRIGIESRYKSMKSVINTTGETLFADIRNPLVNISNAYSWPFIEEYSDYFKILAGNWNVDRPIVLKGKVVIDQGVQLNFSNGAYLIVKGEVEFLGTKDDPIILKGIKDDWRGLYILSKKNHRSILSNVLVENPSSIDDGILRLSGGISVYGGSLHVNGLRIRGASSEDALNVIGANIDISDLDISSSFSDGFDCDYCTGRIKSSTLSDIGGDALDFSGSSVDIRNVHISGVKDKGVSVGEKSRILLSHGIIDKVGVGVASKDGSQTYIDNTSIDHYELHGVMTYVKKEYYNAPTSLEFNKGNIGGHNPYKRQTETKLIVDGELVGGSDINVKKMYRSGIMKK